MEYEEPKFFHVMEYAAAADDDVIDMVSGNPDWEPPAALREALHEYAGLPSDAFQYPPSEGLRELREAIGARRNVNPDRVVVTNGTGEANYLAMARAFERDAGDEALLMDPFTRTTRGRPSCSAGRRRSSRPSVTARWTSTRSERRRARRPR